MARSNEHRVHARIALVVDAGFLGADQHCLPNVQQPAAAFNADRLVVGLAVVGIGSGFLQVDVRVAEIGLSPRRRLEAHHQARTVGIGRSPVDKREVLDQHIAGPIQRNAVFPTGHGQIHDRGVAFCQDQAAGIVVGGRARLVLINGAGKAGLVE